ncbi:centriolar satellite-associated tubulin polyglutamylase complex regulator 1 isoform X3 [Artibeus jamaicensis]|uniref:centriolar satellite-associated tubulin polyglutamylase complex regulator 1 isoform X3 n=1 Tax=Artibeus jamaicensis TaxID=9417 RepID=UPI00187C1CFF|nr:centriolar satellite-associated tubulin polyglutamylase complex regulator 1 isoform X3 [Artibeus jamaicensis]
MSGNTHSLSGIQLHPSHPSQQGIILTGFLEVLPNRGQKWRATVLPKKIKLKNTACCSSGASLDGDTALGDLLTMKEYHCLLQLLCPDFPLELTQKAARIVLMDDAVDCLMSFSDFLLAFQIQFYYSEFLESVAAIYQDLLSGKNPNTVIVPTSSSGQHRQRPALGETSTLEGVEASLFYQRLESLCDRHKYSCPPPAVVREVLGNVQRLTFYGFLVALSKHHGTNQALGALPDKGDLMHDPAMDEELERLLAQIPDLVNSVTASSEASCLPSRTPHRAGFSWRTLHHTRKVDAESDGSTEETDESET